MAGLASLPFLAGFCYTQLTDIEQEINGLLTYDRQFKADPACSPRFTVNCSTTRWLAFPRGVPNGD